MIAVPDRFAGRTAFLIIACASLAVGIGTAAKLSGPLPDAHLLLIPLAALATSLYAAQLRIDNSRWRLETPFLALTLAVLGPWSLIALAIAIALSIAFVRTGMVRFEREIIGPLALGIACAAVVLVKQLIPLSAATSALLFALTWRTLQLGLERKLRASAIQVLLPSGIALILGGLYDEGFFWATLLGTVPIALFGLIARRQSESDRRHRETLQALALMLQRAHPYTHAHIERVACIAENTALRLGLSLERSRLIHEAARLHDIGKIAVDEQVLDKPGKLTTDEYNHVKLHAPYGAAILEEIDELRGLADWIRFHHERPDGRGYPNGLIGPQIPLEAKIIAVADAFDAMTGGFDGGEKRPYRDPLSPAEAMIEMERCAGSQFDRAVVDAFKLALQEEALP